jgi:hypothetical protein
MIEGAVLLEILESRPTNVQGCKAIILGDRRGLQQAWHLLYHMRMFCYPTIRLTILYRWNIIAPSFFHFGPTKTFFFGQIVAFPSVIPFKMFIWCCLILWIKGTCKSICWISVYNTVLNHVSLPDFRFNEADNKAAHYIFCVQKEFCETGLISAFFTLVRLVFDLHLIWPTCVASN